MNNKKLVVEEWKTEKKLYEFKTDNLTNNEIGQKIKVYAKLLHSISKVICFICIIASIICLIKVSVIAGIISFLLTILAYIVFYFIFLLETGFGALIEDISNLKKK